MGSDLTSSAERVNGDDVRLPHLSFAVMPLPFAELPEPLPLGVPLLLPLGPLPYLLKRKKNANKTKQKESN